MRHLKTRTLLGLICASLAIPAALADSAVPDPIDACSRLRRDSERLACYDRAVADLRAGKDGKTVASPENMFGASSGMTPAAAATQENREDELKKITAKVVSLREMDDGDLLLTLDNEQVWRQQDSDFRLTIQPGDSVTISRASLGTFRITDTRGRTARFKRVR